MEGNLISVIVPIYNTEKYLEKCITSILDQSYHNLEVILINDGSTDNSEEICNRFQEIDKRIIVKYQENSGVSVARNQGLKIAKGDFISFVDSDDYLHPEMLERLWNYLKEYNADIAMCDFFKVFDGKLIEQCYEKNIVKQLDSVQALKRLFGSSLEQAVVVTNKLLMKELLSDIRFPAGKIHEDTFTTYKLYYKAKKIIYTNEKLYYRIRRVDSIIGKGFNIKSLDVLDAHAERTDFFRKHNLPDLYKLSINIYMMRIIKFFGKCIDSDDIEEETIRRLLLRFREEFKRFGYMKGLSWRHRVNYFLFYINPLIYKASIKGRRIIYRIIR